MIARRDFLRDAAALGAATLAGWRAFAAEEGLPGYYGDYLAGIAAKVKARAAKCRDAFWFFTDPHVPDNRRMSGRVLARLIRERREKERNVVLREPEVMAIITDGEFAYRREDGIVVCPLSCLKP